MIFLSGTMFDRKLFEDFFDDIEPQNIDSDVVSHNDVVIEHNDSWEARFQLVVNIYSIITTEEKKKDMAGQNTNNLYITSNIIKKLFRTMRFVDNFDIVIKLARKHFGELLEEPFAVEPTFKDQFIMDLVNLKKYNTDSISFNLYIDVYFKVEHSVSVEKFYDDIKKLCLVLYNYELLNLSNSDYFYLVKMPYEDNTVYKCNGNLPNMKKQVVDIYKNLIDSKFGEDGDIDTEYINFKKLRIKNRVAEFVSETNLPIKKAECYVVPPFVQEGGEKSFLVIELYINKEHPELGSISQNNVLSEVTKYIFSDEQFNVMISHYFTTVVIARKADGSDSFKRLGGPHVYDNNKYVCPWKFLQRRGKGGYSKLYAFKGMESYQYGKDI